MIASRLFPHLVPLLLGMLLTLPAAVTADAAQRRCVAPAQWLRLSDMQPMSNSEALRSMNSRRVVLLGEHHDNADHHRWQLQVLAGLYALRPDMAIGFEMFSQDVQPALDKWVAGELSEAEFLKQSNWYGNWNFDPAYYMPLFHFARLNHIPMIALNIDRKLFAEVQEKGWDGVPVADRQGISDPAPPLEGYVKMLAGSFMQHHRGGAQGHGERKLEEFTPEEKEAFGRFVEGQQLWDRAMAQNLTKATRRDKPPLVVGIMGSGHLMEGFGVPHQLDALGVKDNATVVPWDEELSCEDLTKDFASAVFGMESAASVEEDKPRLGVYLQPEAKGVRVAKVAEHSVAEAGGITAGDIIVALAGTPTRNVSDVVGIVQRMVPGTWLPVIVLRDGKQLEVVAKFPAQKQ